MWGKMLKIKIKTQPYKKMRYKTCGDYWDAKDGTTHIRVADMGNDRYEFLVAVHELIEQFLTKQRGVAEEDITDFDVNFEKERAMGIHRVDDEPGDDHEAPYRKEHFTATNIERLIAHELGIDWATYSNFEVGI